MKTINDYQQEVLKAKDETIDVLRSYLAYIAKAKARIQELEEENQKLRGDIHDLKLN
jgi:hypothetical protein